jgi:predicted acyl esterase
MLSFWLHPMEVARQRIYHHARQPSYVLLPVVE